MPLILLTCHERNHNQLEAGICFLPPSEAALRVLFDPTEMLAMKRETDVSQPCLPSGDAVHSRSRSRQSEREPLLVGGKGPTITTTPVQDPIDGAHLHAFDFDGAS